MDEDGMKMHYEVDTYFVLKQMSMYIDIFTFPVGRMYG